MCPNHNGPLCTTCTLAGLVRCPILGVPLPLVDCEKPTVEKKTRRVHPLDDSEAMKIWKFMNDGRTD